ncbi:MAG: hypothetical protein ACR2JB_18885 [Bryobacteraceae bacterium]
MTALGPSVVFEIVAQEIRERRENSAARVLVIAVFSKAAALYVVRTQTVNLRDGKSPTVAPEPPKFLV